MNLPYSLIPSTNQRYLIRGSNPTLLIVSGTHGDEYESIPFVEEEVEHNFDKLPDCVYIPIVSPSAVALRTRKNKDGLDVNRNFYPDCTSEEIQQLMRLWDQFTFETFLTFHEDPEQTMFYLYDGVTSEFASTYRLSGTPQLAKLQNDILRLGVELYNGIDDQNDTHLGYSVRDGYAFWPMVHNDHSSDYWLLVETHHAKHVINPEIPGKIPLDRKRLIIEAIFKRLVLKD